MPSYFRVLTPLVRSALGTGVVCNSFQPGRVWFFVLGEGVVR